MGKKHSEEAVIPILQRKGIIVEQFYYDENGAMIPSKRIGIPVNVNPGIRILGKLDFMRKMGYLVMKTADMAIEKSKPQKRKSEDEPKKFKTKKVINKMRN